MKAVGASQDVHLTPAEYAERVGCSRDAVYKAIHAGRLPYKRKRVGIESYTYRIPASALPEDVRAAEAVEQAA